LCKNQGELRLITRKEALHEGLKALSPIQLHYVWGLLDGLRHIESVTGKTGQELPGKNAQSNGLRTQTAQFAGTDINAMRRRKEEQTNG
jgi:hypothetical protein